MSEALLEVDDLTVAYGGVVALDKVSFKVDTGEILGLIGPNGAGKTTLIDALTGYATPRQGSIRLAGRELGGLPPHARARAGLGRTFQSVELFDDLTVEENLLVAAERCDVPRALAGIFVDRHDAHAKTVEWALRVADLTGVAKRSPRQLSHGRRKLVGVARALAQEPQLLLLDEPAAGLDTTETGELGQRLRSVPEHGGTVLLVDHDMSLVLGICDRVLVLDFGRLISAGTPDEVRADPEVARAYLGSRAELIGRGN